MTETPRGFHIMMPRGWVRYLIDAEGKRAVIAQASARMRELSRPDLDAQARTMIECYWRTLKANRISAVYLPSDPEGGGAPLSIAVKQHVAPPGRPFADSLRALASGASVETLDTSIGTVLRWVKDSHGTGEFDGVASRQIGYGFPLPGADEHRGMVFRRRCLYSLAARAANRPQRRAVEHGPAHPRSHRRGGCRGSAGRARRVGGRGRPAALAADREGLEQARAAVLAKLRTTTYITEREERAAPRRTAVPGWKERRR